MKRSAISSNSCCWKSGEAGERRGIRLVGARDGRGMPIECSAMGFFFYTCDLGFELEVHGGGIDLKSRITRKRRAADVRRNPAIEVVTCDAQRLVTHDDEPRRCEGALGNFSRCATCCRSSATRKSWLILLARQYRGPNYLSDRPAQHAGGTSAQTASKPALRDMPTVCRALREHHTRFKEVMDDDFKIPKPTGGSADADARDQHRTRR